MFRKTLPRITSLILISVLSILGCKSDTKTKNVEGGSAVISPVDTSITLNERSYEKLSIDGLPELSFKAYWPSGIELSTNDGNSLLESLQLINNVLINHLQLSLPSFEHKSVVFTPHEINSDKTIEITQVNNELIHITFPVNSHAIDDFVTQDIVSHLYVAERNKQSSEESLFSQVIAKGLALHLIDESFESNLLFAENQLTDAELTAALTELSIVLNEHNDNWFEQEAVTMAVGYYLAEQYFTTFPGSKASNVFNVLSENFVQWIHSLASQEHKLEQYVRTDDVPNQIHVSELTRQANEFFGSYFLEGYNNEKLIALTFDDGPSLYTDKILDVLAQANIKASFFWQGSRLTQFKTIIERAQLAGHTIANHSWNHPHSAKFSTQKLWNEQVLKTNNEMYKQLGITPRFYRPPYGEVSDEQILFLEAQGMKVMLWSVDSRDWNPETNSKSHIVDEIITHQHAEMITLMHDSGGNRQNTVDALPEIIEHYKNQGYRFVNLQTLLGISDKG